MKRNKTKLFLLFTIISLTSCSFSNGDSEKDKPQIIPVQAVHLNYTAYELNIGESIQLISTVYPNNASDKEVNWSITSGNEYVSVSKSGLVEAIKEGNSVVTVRTVDGNKTADCKIKVKNEIIDEDIHVESVSLSKKEYELDVGDNVQLEVNITPINATNKKLNWSITSGNEYVSVSNDGLVNALASGTSTITVTSEDGDKTDSCTIKVKEEIDEDYVEWIGNVSYPYYSTASTRFAQSLECGWNLGNSLDAHHDSVNVEESYIDFAGTISKNIPEMDTEICYGNPRITSTLLRKVREAGYTSIRIPVSWHQHVTINNNFKISESWINRVKTVVDQALGLGFKVILNTHHDIDPSFIYPDNAHLENSKKFIKSVWGQISDVFGSYDTNLVYEGFNEPRLTKNADSFNTELNTEEVNNCIAILNQTFVDTIRANTLLTEQKRFLIVKSYADSAYIIIYSNASKFNLPIDPSNRLIVSTHIYSPTEFAFHGTGGFDPSKEEDTSNIKWLLDGLYANYISKGIGVIVGEWGSVANNNNYQDRLNHANYFVEQTYLRHISSFYWDNGNLDGEAFALFNREQETNKYPELNAQINSYWIKPGNIYDVNYYVGDFLLDSEKVNENRTVIGPNLPWGYGYDNLFSDAKCSTIFDITTKITGNTNIYLSNYGVRPTSTCDADNSWGPIDNQYITINNGEWHCNAPGKGKNNNYETQVNFTLPVLLENKNYKISFAYQISGPNGLSLIYNDNTNKSVGNNINLNGDGQWHIETIYFNSNEVTYGETRFTFSLSSIPSTYSSINFGIKDLSINLQ